MRLTCGIIVSLWLVGLASHLSAGDWPMWRHDAGRTGSTPDTLPTDLQLRWTRELPALRPAWPQSQHKLQFDADYQPVVASGRMFVGSNVNDTVTAYDAETGDELWRYYTDGPVRFPPAVWNDRVYAVSDDGRLYCLDAASGDLVWKYNGRPRRRPILGNDRLISTWPARGGVVVDDGVAYFASGIWPSMGIFIHAVDAETGKRLWINSDTSNRFVTHPHGADSFGSISPQGALAVSGENLIVPGGRTLPAVFDRMTGKLKHFDFGGKASGGHEVMAAGPLLAVRNEIFRTEDGASIGRMFASVATDKYIIGSEAAGESIVVTSIGGEKKDSKVTDRRGRKSTHSVFTPDSTRRFTPTVPGNVLLVAGEQLYLAADGQVAAYDLSTAFDAKGKVEPIATLDVEGGVAGLIAADQKLFVVTKDSRILGYATGNHKPLVHQHEPAALPEADSDVKDRAKELLELAPMAGGYAVSLDAGEPELLLELVRQSDYHIIAVDADANRVAALRESADGAGIYGTRLTAHVWPPFDFNFPPYLADLVVSSESGFYSTHEVSAIFNVLRPYGGTACLRANNAQHKEIASTVEQAKLENAYLERVGEWTVLRRVGALPNSGQWTHQYGDATNSVTSQEARVKTPMGVLWFGGPSNDKVLPRHGHGPSPHVVGGRLFIEGPDMLRCVDVYTGRVWWERDLPGIGAFYDNTSHQPGAGEIGSNYVSLEDHVYVIYEKQLLELDARTGETTREFLLPAEEGGVEAQPHWGSLAVSGDVLVATANPARLIGMEYSQKPSIPKGSHAVVEPHAQWRILAGEDPPPKWTAPDFDDSGWRSAEAGFGYGDNDDRTVLDGMRGKFSRVYARTEFDARSVADATQLTLMIHFDDAFIAYLNGKEILRINVGEGSGAAARRIRSHEAEGYEPHAIPDFRNLLRPGRNVLAIEGHNDGANSSDFSLDPYLIATSSQDEDARPGLADYIEPAQYSSSSRALVAFDRHTGSLLWSRAANYSFRHNTVCLSDNTAYTIDGMSPKALALLRRRGISTSTAPELLALDLHTGDVKWSTQENVFGTFLNYSKEHDILLQSGSAYRDRAKDEVDTGLVAYRGTDGEVLWERMDLQYGGPCLLVRDRLITNGSGGFELNLLTGESTGWDYTRMYGCNTAIGCQTLLTFRSGAAGFYDLTNDSGTGNLGGFKSSCTSNLIPADGLLNAPDYTRTCVCAYQLQTSLAFVHMDEADSWTFNPANSLSLPLKSVGLNLGAPGDRRDREGVLWFDYPVVGGPSPDLSVTTSPQKPEWFLKHTLLVDADELGWVGGSGARNLRSLKWNVEQLVTPGDYRVRLVFAAPESAADRANLSVTVNGGPATQIESAEVQSEGVLIKDIPAVPIDGTLEVTLAPSSAAAGPSLCGLAIIAEQRP